MKPVFVHDVIREHLLEARGIIEDNIKEPLPDLECLMQTEWDWNYLGRVLNKFFSQCLNRTCMGAFRYGLLNKPGKPKYDRVGSIRKRLDLFEETGNGEHLVDITNLCMLETVEPNHPNFHFEAQDGGHHTKEII